MSDLFAEVILPIPVRERFTYRIPEEITRQITPLERVIVPLGNNKQTKALVTSVFTENPDGRKMKEIIAAADEHPVIHSVNFGLWQWISRYYMCPEGDVLKAALPAGRQQDKAGLKFQAVVCLHPDADNPEKWSETLENLKRAVKQKKILLYFAQKIFQQFAKFGSFG